MRNSRTKMVIKNMIFTAIAQIITMLTSALVPKLMLTYYGSSVNGLITSISQIVNYLALIEGGVAEASIYALYKPIAENNIDRINAIVYTTKKSYYKIGAFLTGALVIISFIYPTIIKTNKLSYFEIFFLFIIMGLNVVIDAFVLAKYRALLSADQHTYIVSISNACQLLLSAIIIFVLSINHTNIVIVRLVALSSFLIKSLILYIYCKKKYKSIDFKAKISSTVKLEKKWDALFIQIIGAIHRGAPIVIITILLSLNDVSIYSIYGMIMTGVSSILPIFMNGFQSSFGDVLARNESDILKKAYEEYETAYMFFSTILYSVTIITILPFVKIYTLNADINYVYPSLAVLFTINDYLYFLKNPQNMITVSAGLYKETKIQAVVQCLICVIFGSVFCYFFGLVGILLGRILSNIYRDIDYLLFLPNHFKNLSSKKTIGKWLLSFICLIICTFIGHIIDTVFVKTFFEWLLFALVVFIVCCIFIGIIYYLFYKKDLHSMKKRLIVIINKIKKSGGTS